jgi:hypothetical protein
MSATGLERFWMRRRSMAFDELCRMTSTTPAGAR